jgi:H+/Cl- antiporter ClcA
MTMATTFLYGSFVLIGLLSIFYFWTMNELPKTKANTRQGKLQGIQHFLHAWQKSLFLWVIILILYFIFYGALMIVTMETTKAFDETGAVIAQMKTDDYRFGWELLKIVIALIYIDTAVLIWRIFNQTQILFIVLGERFKQKKPSKYQDFV